MKRRTSVGLRRLDGRSRGGQTDCLEAIRPSGDQSDGFEAVRLAALGRSDGRSWDSQTDGQEIVRWTARLKWPRNMV